MDFILWLSFPIKALSCCSRYRSHSLVVFVVSVSPSYSCNFCLLPSLLIEAVHSLARPLSSSGSLLDLSPQNFPSIIPWLVVTLLHGRDSLGSSFTEILSSLRDCSEIPPPPVSLQASISWGEVGKTTLFDLFIVGRV